jgi:hypothetical protein
MARSRSKSPLQTIGKWKVGEWGIPAPPGGPPPTRPKQQSPQALVTAAAVLIAAVAVALLHPFIALKVAIVDFILLAWYRSKCSKQLNEVLKTWEQELAEHKSDNAHHEDYVEYEQDCALLRRRFSTAPAYGEFDHEGEKEPFSEGEDEDDSHFYDSGYPTEEIDEYVEDYQTESEPEMNDNDEFDSDNEDAKYFTADRECLAGYMCQDYSESDDESSPPHPDGWYDPSVYCAPMDDARATLNAHVDGSRRNMKAFEEERKNDEYGMMDDFKPEYEMMKDKYLDVSF